MAYEVRMTKLSPTMETGTINRWLKKEGDKIAAGDAIAEVETDKASMPLESFDEGILLKIMQPEGATLKVDALVAIVGNKGEDISAMTTGAPAAAAPVIAPKAAAPAAETKAAPAAAAKTPPAAPAAAAASVAATPSSGSGRLKASPMAKKVAKERGIDLNGVQPTGPGGRIIQRDVESAPVPNAAPAAPAPLAAVAAGDTDLPLSNLRQTIAKRLLQSKQTIPHFYLYSEISMDRAMAFREELNEQLEEGAAKISVNDLITKVAAAALARHPEVNATFNQTSIRRYGDVNIAVAVATDDGLYTPVLRNVDRLSLRAISAGVKQMAQKAREKKLKADDLKGSGFTITNLGMYGVDHFFAIINPPEAAILAIGAVQTKPVVNAAGQVVAGKVMGLTLSCDHRIVDGAVGAKFMATMKQLLEHPAKLLL